MMTVFSFGIIKGILTYMGQSTAPTTLDWVLGALLAVVLYWIGLYEERDSKKGEWFFRVDLAPAIGYCAKRVVAEGKSEHSCIASRGGAGIDANERTNSPVAAALPRWHCHYHLA
ncbi:hypothetical protein V8E53_005664, partial [Lactarius tabidus]